MAPLGRSPLLGALVGRAIASESCAASGTCAEESTLLQLHKLKDVARSSAKTQSSDDLWPQFDISPSKCNSNIGVQYVSSQADCQAVAVAAGHEFYSYRHNADSSADDASVAQKCFSSDHCDDGLIGDRTNEWNIYRSNPGSLWSQYEVDRSKCNTNVDLQYADSQEDCQAIAEANGHGYYSYRHNADSSGSHKCFSSAVCDDGNEHIGDRTNHWRIYRNSDLVTLAGYGPGNFGACRTADDDMGSGMYSRADHTDSVEQCSSECDASPTCFAFEFIGVTGGNTGCELHRQSMPATNGIPNGLCYNKIPDGPLLAGYGPGNFGACRTADDDMGSGMYSRADHTDSIEQCASECNASPTCLAFEFTGVTGGNTGCELHRQPMPAATGHPNGVCYNSLPVQ